MALFARIVESGSFARAARDLGVARSTATEALKVLEAEVGARLLVRTTRHVAPSPEGQEFYYRARTILSEVEEAYSTFQDNTPRGHLRLNASGVLTRAFIVPRLSEFMAQYPQLSLEFGQTDRLVDLVREGVDCVIRVGAPEDNSLMLRRLGALTEITCASRAYLEAHGVPKSIDDLDGHQMVGFVSSRSGEVLPLEFQRDGRTETRRIPARVTTDNSDTAAALAAQGFGLLQAPRYRFEAQLAAGTLVELLPETPPERLPINAIYPGSRQMCRRLDVFLAWATVVFEQAR